jgi:hypothetical protein
MVGSVGVTCSDHAARVEFDLDRVIFHFQDFRSARQFNRVRLPDLRTVSHLLKSSQRLLFVKVGDRGEIELFPNPRWWVRLLSRNVRLLSLD